MSGFIGGGGGGVSATHDHSGSGQGPNLAQSVITGLATKLSEKIANPMTTEDDHLIGGEGGVVTRLSAAAWAAKVLAAVANMPDINIPLYPNTIGAGNLIVSSVGSWAAYSDAHGVNGGYLGNNVSNSDGDAVSIGPIAVPVTGTYALYLGTTYQGGRPRLDVTVNGGSVLGTFNCNAGGGLFALLGPVSLGTLTAGTEYTIRLTINGRDEGATMWQCTLSSLLLRRTA